LDNKTRIIVSAYDVYVQPVQYFSKFVYA